MASRDFLRVFGAGAHSPGPPQDAAATGAGAGHPDDVELSLGLSLGGCFGTDAKSPRLVRSSFTGFVSSLHADADGEGAGPPEEAAATGAGAGHREDDVELSLGLYLGSRFGTDAKRPGLARSSSSASVSLLHADGDADGEWACPSEDAAATGAGHPDDVELSLGLSLGGRFGTDAKRPRLARSSSTAFVSSQHADWDADADADWEETEETETEAEEERWRRREMQSRRCLEACWKGVERRNSMGWLAPAGPKPAVGSSGKRSIGSPGSLQSSQGSNSVSTTEQDWDEESEDSDEDEESEDADEDEESEDAYEDEDEESEDAHKIFAPSSYKEDVQRCLRLAVKCGATEDRNEYFMATQLFKDKYNRQVFRNISTNKGRFLWLRRLPAKLARILIDTSENLARARLSNCSFYYICTAVVRSLAIK